MKSLTASVCIAAVAWVVCTCDAQAQSRFLLMEGSGEFGWSINRPSKINGEAEGRALALDAINGRIEGMANIQAFEQFSNRQVVQTLKNKYEQIGPYVANTTTFTRDDRREDAFKGNRRGLVVTVQEMGFKPGTFQNSSDYNKLTGVRKSRASGILLYRFRVFAPEGYKPDGSGDVVKVKYTIWNDSGRTVRFSMQPSGRSYVLEAGKTFEGTSHQVDGDAPTITLSDSGRTIKLTRGNHKIWWKKDESRVALDLNYDK